MRNIFGLGQRGTPPIRVGGSAFAIQSRVNEVALATGRKPAGMVRAAAQTSTLQFASPAPVIALGQSSSSVTPRGDRLILDNPRNAWQLMLPEKLTPKQILVILRAAIAGDCYRAYELKQLMMRTWPMLRKCSHELRQPVSNVRYTVKEAQPAKKGATPSPLAVEKADLIRRATANFARFRLVTSGRGKVSSTT